MTKKDKPRPMEADYKGATPREVAAAVLRYRPKQAKKPKRSGGRAVNPSI